MAKKRKSQPEDGEEVDFKVPKFNEEDFIRKERRNIRTLFLSFILGAIIAIISFGFWILLVDSDFRWPLLMLFGIANISWLRYLFIRLKIDLKDFGKKGWFGSYAVYIFSWLIVLIILVNPPFYDEESPAVSMIILPGMQEPGGTVEIVAKITDNVGVNENDITLIITDPNGTTKNPIFSFEDNFIKYTFENIENIMGEYTCTLMVTDVSSHMTNTSMTFEYSNETLSIISSRFEDLRSGDPIVIAADEKISESNFRVYYTVDDGEQINVERDNPDDKEKYETTPEFEGWNRNSNVTVNVYTEVIYYFENTMEEFNNTIIDSTPYSFTTGDDSNIGTEDILVEYDHSKDITDSKHDENELSYPLPKPKIVSTPGFEIIILLVSLVIAVLIIRFRKKK